MPKPFYFLVGIEEIAVGTWMRRNAEMPGVLTIEPQLDRKPPSAPALPGANGNGHGNIQQAVLALLVEGPKTARELAPMIGGTPNRVHGSLHGLMKKGLAKSINKVWHAAAETGALARPAALPAPKGPMGRASSGASRQVMLDALATAPMRSKDIAAQLVAAGVSARSLSGVLDRGKRDGIIKKNSDGLYELTAKGRKSGEAHANG